jgi:hypothetical protein
MGTGSPEEGHSIPPSYIRVITWEFRGSIFRFHPQTLLLFLIFGMDVDYEELYPKIYHCDAIFSPSASCFCL